MTNMYIKYEIQKSVRVPKGSQLQQCKTAVIVYCCLQRKNVDVNVYKYTFVTGFTLEYPTVRFTNTMKRNSSLDL